MKINEPVTNNEVVMKDGQFLVSTTDLKGIITSANRAFVEMSGYSVDELVGRNHNIVRHPDMPPEAFEDLWQTIKAGRPWVGLVKNRRKDGDYYWVKANVTPMRVKGQVTGYMSVRTKPTRQEIESAEVLYRDIRSGKATLKPSFLQRMKNRMMDFGVTRYFMTAAVTSIAGMGILAWLGHEGASVTVLDATLAVLSLLTLLGAWALSRYVNRPLQTAVNALQEIADGDYLNWVESHRNDTLGNMLQNLQSAQIRLGYAVNEIRNQANELNRVKAALESVDAAVMITDEDHRVIYLNAALQKMMEKAQERIREKLPDFDANQLIGRDIDFLGGAMELDSGLLNNLQDNHCHEFAINGLTFRISVNPVLDESGHRIGTVVEWQDRTEEVAVEQEIQDIVDAALVGNLTERIDLTGKEGFFATLGQRVNQLVEVLDNVVADTASVISALARGDLSHTIDSEYEGSFARLKEDVNATVKNLTRVIKSIRTSADAVEQASREIAEGNTDLARRTEMQASNLEETASSMEEITSTVRQNADNSRKASNLSKETLDQAVAGGSVVSETISAMEKITESSKKIAAIIGVIDDIAFQTNLLALNAAVEAARAGEQGRGFAVVATEVRNLAQRSATAAKEIKTLIEDSVAKVEEGSELVNQSGKTLEEIVESVKKVSDFIAEIAAASSEQYVGIEQVNQAVSQMDEVTQQNAALVEEAAQTSQMMDEQAKELSELITFFKVGDSRPQGGWDGVERRSPARPWSNRQKGGTRLDFSSARAKHKLWKTRLRAFLDGESSMSEEEAVSHHDCDLGKWLYSDALEQYGDLPEMKELEKIHAEMHALIKRVIHAGNQGDRQKAESIFARVSRYSDQIVSLLDQLEKKTGNGGEVVPHPASAENSQVQAVGAEELWEEF